MKLKEYLRKVYAFLNTLDLEVYIFLLVFLLILILAIFFKQEPTIYAYD